MQDSKLKAISWIAAFLSIVGIILNALRYIQSWPVWLASNVFWLYYSTKTKQPAQITLWLVFMAANIFGWWSWHRLAELNAQIPY